MSAKIGKAVGRIVHALLITYAVIQVASQYHLGLWLGLLLWEVVIDVLAIYYAIVDRK